MLLYCTDSINYNHMSENRGEQTPATPSPALIKAVKQLLRPVVGLLLDNGLTYTWLTRVLKRIFVEVAESEFTLEGKPQTDSRISLVSGVHRRDVNSIRNEGPDNYLPPPSIFLGPKIVAVWISEDRFLDAKGQPAPLPRLSSQRDAGGPGSFEELVALVRTDVRARAILDEMTRLDVVRLDDVDRVHLQHDSFVPSKGFEEKMYFLGRNIHDHVAASRINVRSDAPPFLERSVYYDQLSESSVRDLAALSRRRSTEILQELNSFARKLQSEDEGSGEANHRMNFGYYFYQEPDEKTGIKPDED